jgi:hypothetical protein
MHVLMRGTCVRKYSRPTNWIGSWGTSVLYETEKGTIYFSNNWVKEEYSVMLLMLCMSVSQKMLTFI